MKINAILIILLTLIIQGITSLFIYDVTNIKLKNSYGHFHAELGISYINMFEDASTWRRECLSSSENDTDPTHGCNLNFYGIFCFTKINHIPFKRYTMFTVDAYNNVVDKSSNYANVFHCTKIKSYFVGLSVNSARYSHPFPNLGEKDLRNYRNGFFFQVLVGDTKFMGYTFYPYIDVQKVSYASLLLAKDFTFTGYINMFYSAWKLVMITYGGCLNNYYGENCLFYCKDDERRKCNCIKQKTGYICDPECQPWWVASYDRYIVPNTNVTVYIRMCNIRDLCADDILCPGSICFQLDNFTQNCYLIYPLIKRDNVGPNLTSDVVLVGEIYSINLSASLIANPLLHKNYQVYLIRKSPPFLQSIFKYMDGYGIPYIKVIGDTFIDSYLYLPIHFLYKPFNTKNVETIKKFRIYVPPKDIELRDMETNQKLGIYIFIGQKISCNSSGNPVYRIIKIWRGSLNFQYKFGDVQEIPKGSYLGVATITCEVILICQGRKSISLIRNFTKYIKAQSALYWNISDNIITEGQYIACISVTFVKYTMNIFQIEGFSLIEPVKNMVNLSGLTGGFYKLCCAWNHHYSLTTLKFYLRTQASVICFMLHPNVIGTLIQCTHNGFFKDDYITKVKASYLSDRDLIKMSEESFIRLPYDINSNSITLTCTIVSKIPGFKTQNITNTIPLSTLSREIYTLTDSFKDCPNFDNYMEFPDIASYNLNSVEIVHLVYYYKETETASFFQIFVLFIIYAVVTGFSFITFVFSDSVIKKKGLYYHVGTLLRISRMRRINDRFGVTSKKFLSLQPSAISLLQTKLENLVDSI